MLVAVIFLFVPFAPSSNTKRSESATVLLAVAPSISIAKAGIEPLLNPDPVSHERPELPSDLRNPPLTGVAGKT